MKKHFTTLLFFIFGFTLFAQVPQGINFQAVARNSMGEPIMNQPVAVQFRILQGGPNGAQDFIENHQQVLTDTCGMFTRTIGYANPTDFSQIDWSTGSKWLEVTINGTIIGTTEMLSVPYALYAASGPSGETNKIGILEYKVLHNGGELPQQTVPGVWNKRMLNEQVVNTMTDYLYFNNSDDAFVLQPGTYLIRTIAAGNYCNGNTIRIRNTQSNQYAILGTPEYSKNDDYDSENNFATLEGILSVTLPDSGFVLEHFIQNLPTDSSFNDKVFGDYPWPTSSIEAVWTRIVIQKLN